MADETLAGALLAAAQACIDVVSWSMIRNSGNRFSEKIRLKQKDNARA
jgi:hypothetical protein